ncbi:hypothetical protein [Kitasatospora sp. NPDC090091]|uniref:hypothetical protein n=1 Tax=Kitasatospora sp. NPDC090091 TaxID=3364081 RepID=UPI0037F7E372
MTGRKLRFGIAALGLLALPLAAAAPAAAAPTYRVDCPSSKYYWCDQVSSDGVIADLMIHNGPDTGGHDVAYIDFLTSHGGQKVWILTSNGSGGWTWEGVEATHYIGYGFFMIDTQIRSDRGVLIKLAAYNYETGAYMYTNAH